MNVYAIVYIYAYGLQTCNLKFKTVILSYANNNNNNNKEIKCDELNT